LKWKRKGFYWEKRQRGHPGETKENTTDKHISEIFVYVNQIGVARNDFGIGNQNEEQQDKWMKTISLTTCELHYQKIMD